MFNLEKSISEWRHQMLAAGIKTPVPLEELEIHLREEITRLGMTGVAESEAFSAAVEKIGPGWLLQGEFQKTKRLGATRIISIVVGAAAFSDGSYQVWLLASKSPELQNLSGEKTVLLGGVILAFVLATALVFLGLILAFCGGRNISWLRNTRTDRKYV